MTNEDQIMHSMCDTPCSPECPPPLAEKNRRARVLVHGPKRPCGDVLIGGEATDWRDVTCSDCKLAGPIEAKVSDRYFLSGAGADVLKRDAALARADRYRRRLHEVRALEEHSREVMTEWAKRLGETMALRERIERELSEAESAVDSFEVPTATPGQDRPSPTRSAGGSYGPEQPRLRLVDTVPGGRPISKPQPY